MMKRKIKELIEIIVYLIESIPVVMAIDEYDPELWDNPRKKARIRRRMERRERRLNGKKADV